jgi:glycosyltransferase involved in cell wall biosynthesis
VGEEFFGVVREERDHVLYYGRFDVYQKGLDVLLEAMTRLGARGGAPPPLLMLGRGRDAERVRRMVAERGLAGRVTIRENPTREEVLVAMSGARALVHPSRFEGLPMVPAEAMAAGVPVVATDVGAVAEVLDGGRAGILVAPNEPDALAAALESVLGDAARRATLGAAARASAGRFRWDRVADEHHEFLKAVAAGGARRP